MFAELVFAGSALAFLLGSAFLLSTTTMIMVGICILCFCIILFRYGRNSTSLRTCLFTDTFMLATVIIPYLITTDAPWWL